MKNMLITFYKNNDKGDSITDKIFQLEETENDKVSLKFDTVDIRNMYDHKGNIIRQTCIRSDGIMTRDTICKYNSDGKLIETNFKDMNFIVKYKYDDKGNCINKYSNEGHYDNMEYDDKGRIIKSLNEDGLIIRYEYDEENNIQTVIYPGDIIYKYYHDKEGRCIYGETSDGDRMFKNIYMDGICIGITELGTKVNIDIIEHKDIYDIFKNIFESTNLATKEENDDIEVIIKSSDLRERYKIDIDKYPWLSDLLFEN